MELASVVWIASAVLSIGWVVAAIVTTRTLLAARHLSSDPARTPAVWPRLSVIIAALDEESTIERALGTLLTSTYPHLELVLVNDRSRDRTGEIMERMAARDARIRVVHVQSLPAGWLGKVHALHLGTKAATGDWLLFTDADVHFLPGCLERAVSVAIADELDHLTLWPRMIAHGVLLRATILAFGVSLIAMVRPHRIGPGSKAFLGIGAFNLVRKSAFDRTRGFEWLKMELADDMAVSKLVVDAGGRTGWRMARDLLEIEWYPSLGAMVRGLEKNTYGIFSRFSVPLFVAKLGAIVAVMSAPAVALLSGGPAWCTLAGAGALTFALGMYVFGARFAGYGLAEAVLGPMMGSIVMFVALVRSAVATWRQGGISWRGTRYSIEELRRGQVVQL
ncbi:glycosyltransferase [Myxococcota bacterium]|nr:glycosyltransferase [Myxococcota bacterium]